LINAVDRYDPRRQVPFADPSILGVLKRHFRDTTWAMRVPSPIQELARRMPDAGVDDRLSISRTSRTCPFASGESASRGSTTT